MATRPVFLWRRDRSQLVEELVIEFSWAAGLSRSQKLRRIAELHRRAADQHPIKTILEISSASPTAFGRSLSAFNLTMYAPDGCTVTVEEAYHSSKVFERGGPFTDLIGIGPIEAKRDARLRESGELVGFSWNGVQCPIKPNTLFYDWLYLKALNQNLSVYTQLQSYDAFSDIEFNPKKSFACQARSAALCTGLFSLGKHTICGDNIDAMKGYYDGGSNPLQRQGSLDL